MSSLTLAGPVATAAEFGQLFTNPQIRDLIFSGMESTFSAIFLGFILAIVVGVPMGIVMGRFLIVDWFLDPWVNSWYSIPVVAFVPLTMSWTGLTYTSAVIVSFLVAVFSIIINVYIGVKNVSNSYVEPAVSFGANQGSLLTEVILPAAMPDVMLGLRLGITRAIDGVIISEMLISTFGLGGVIFDSADKLNMPLANVAVIILALLGIGVNVGMKSLAHKIVAWKEASAMLRE